MPKIHDKESGSLAGEITDAQLQFLIDHLEEESSDDQDYFLDHATVEFLQAEGAEEALIRVLERALAGREGVEIRWS